jgi:hypothetical protein
VVDHTSSFQVVLLSVAVKDSAKYGTDDALSSLKVVYVTLNSVHQQLFVIMAKYIYETCYKLWLSRVCQVTDRLKFYL